MNSAGTIGWPSSKSRLYLDVAELIDLLTPELTPAQKATYDLVRRRMLGDTRLEEAIDKALEICRTPETRDLALEGRLRNGAEVFSDLKKVIQSVQKKI